MTKAQYAHLLHDDPYDFFLVFSLPRGRKRRKFMPALLPVHLMRGVGLGVWLAGSSLGFHLCTRGRGRGQGTTLTHDKIHSSRSSLGVPGKFVPNLVRKLSPNLLQIVCSSSLLQIVSSTPGSWPSPSPWLPFLRPFSIAHCVKFLCTNTPIVFHYYSTFLQNQILQQHQSGEG